MMNRLKLAMVLSIGLASACGGDTSSEQEITINVQETNVSGPPPCETTQSRSVQRQCDQRQVAVYVCDDPSCDAQLDELAAAVAACELDIGQAPYIPDASCEE